MTIRLLVAEGNTLARVKEASRIGVRSASQTYIDAIKRFEPDVECDVLFGADGQRLPKNRMYSDYDGLIMGGSGMHAYDTSPEVTNQIQLMLDYAETGRPILGSCWGLQIAVVATGGEVNKSSVGRELGIARKVSLTAEAQSHPFFHGKRAVFDSPCIHYDEVTRLPEGATLLCSNNHSKVQGAIVPLRNSEVWAVQYHPEFDLTQLRMLFELYREDMLEQGFVVDRQNYNEYLDKYRALEANPTNKALAWQLGLDDDVLDDQTRSLEILNWVNHVRDFD